MGRTQHKIRYERTGIAKVLKTAQFIGMVKLDPLPHTA